MTSIGETLRQQRLRQGIHLQQVSGQTKIGVRLLEAIEAEQWDRLPGGVFTRNFVRQYARAIGLDEDEIRAELRQIEQPEAPPPAAEPRLAEARPPRVPRLKEFGDRLPGDSSVSAFVWVVVAVLFCAGVYSVWQHRRASVTPRAAASASAPPARTAASAPTDVRPAELTSDGTVTLPAPGSPAAMRVTLTAAEEAWVSVRYDGKSAYVGTMKPRETRQFEASRNMTVTVGNAGALEITLNGKSIGPLGLRGQVRMVQLTPAGAHVVLRTPPASSPTSEEATAAAPDLP